MVGLALESAASMEARHEVTPIISTTENPVKQTEMDKNIKILKGRRIRVELGCRESI